MRGNRESEWLNIRSKAMSKKSKLIVATAIAVLTTAIAVLGLGSQAFAVGGGPWPERRIWRCARGQWVSFASVQQCPAAHLQHASASVQSIGAVHRTGVARNSSLACESGFGILKRLKQHQADRRKRCLRNQSCLSWPLRLRLRYSVQSLKHQQKAALFTFIPMNRQRISNDLLV